jgi:hypothetical protein
VRVHVGLCPCVDGGSLVAFRPLSKALFVHYICMGLQDDALRLHWLGC